MQSSFIFQYFNTNLVLLGKNIEPFCVKVNRWTGSSLNAAMGFYSNCAPIYTYESILHGPRKDWRCRKLACYNASGNILMCYIRVLTAP